MIGYKAFNFDLTCRGFQYEIGKEFTFDGEPIPCRQGFHFCKSIGDCYRYYDPTYDVRICKIKATGDVVTDDGIKFVTNKIEIIEEITEGFLKRGNVVSTSLGFCNTGHYNRGDYNTGYSNDGSCNSGSRNKGNFNTGEFNNGDYNSGQYNSGMRNTGNYNKGDRNTGDYNSGNYNVGYYNSGNYNVGVFNTESNPTIKMFDKESNLTIEDWYFSDARIILSRCPLATENRQEWWDELLSNGEKAVIMSLPNFDKYKFEQCTGITV